MSVVALVLTFVAFIAVDCGRNWLRRRVYTAEPQLRGEHQLTRGNKEAERSADVRHVTEGGKDSDGT